MYKYRYCFNPSIPEFLKWTLPFLTLDLSTDANRDFSLKNGMANSVHPDEMARHDPSHQDQEFAQVLVLVCWAVRVNMATRQEKVRELLFFFRVWEVKEFCKKDREFWIPRKLGNLKTVRLWEVFYPFWVENIVIFFLTRKTLFHINAHFRKCLPKNFKQFIFELNN